jgi:aldose sugar dehydrogenase
MHIARRLFVILLSFSSLFVLYACSGKSDFDLIVDPENLEVEVSSPKSLTITVTRKNLEDSWPIVLELENPPMGVSAPPVIMTGSSTSFIITATLVKMYDLTLKATADKLSKTADFSLNVIEAKGFSLTATPSALNLKPLEKAVITLNANRISIADTEPITVKLKDTPGVQSTSAQITGSTGTIELSATQAGNYNLILQATAGGFTKDIPIGLTVSSTPTPPSFDLTLEPKSLQMTPGSTRSVDVFIDRKNGFDKAVTVHASNLPSGVSASDITVAANANSIAFTLTASVDAAPVSQEIILRATGSDGTEDSSTLSLSIIQNGNTNLVKEVIAKDLMVPWDLAFTPSGTLYFTERGGSIKKVVDGSIITLTHSLKVHVETEAGLMGMTFNPGFPQEPYMYVCYSYKDAANVTKNRISRLSVQGNNLTDEKYIIDAMPGSTNHDGCRIIFSPDGKLYASMGDARVAMNAQDKQSLSGKILRVNADGSIPSDNPFGNAVWSYGHRNPQGLAFNSFGLLIISEHGDASDDEVNLIRPGNNYGWPLVEGRCDTSTEIDECNNKGIIEPLTVYTPTLAVSGLAYYDKDMFPDWKGDLLMASLKAEQVYHLDLNPAENVIRREDIVIDYNTYGRIRDIEVGPDGSIYIATSNQDGRAKAPFPGPEDDCIVRWSMQ